MSDPGSVSWRDYVDVRFEAQDKANAIALAAAEKASMAALAAQELAINKAERAQEKRNEDANHIRGAMTDQSKHFASVEKVDGLTERIGKLESQQATAGGKWQGIALVVAGVVTVASLVIGAASLFKS